MAKGKIDLTKLSLGKAKPIKKRKTNLNPSETTSEELAIQKIHDQEEVKIPAPPKEPIIRITVDVVKSMHKAIKMKAMNLDLTIKDYIITLVEKDLKQ